MDWLDITFHALTSVAMGCLMGFFAAMALHVLPFWLAAFPAVAFCATTFFASWLWFPREKKQHGGKMGGRQSWLEAVLPMIAGPVAFGVSLVAFLKFQI